MDNMETNNNSNDTPNENQDFAEYRDEYNSKKKMRSQKSCYDFYNFLRKKIFPSDFLNNFN